MNVLGLTKGQPQTFEAHVNNRRGGLQGKIQMVLDKSYTAKSSADIWDDVAESSANNDSITYICVAYSGSSALAYVGKTLNTMAKRYPKGPAGGLGLVFAFYEHGKYERIDWALYNNSHPALIEGWCYQLLVDQKIPLANQQDPS